MIREIFDVLSAVEDSNTGKTLKRNINLNKSRIRSISSYSSNSIFYFPTIVSDQLMAEEATMALKMIERSYASFVIACIGLMPFHRVSADDKASVENYLQQFHQNIGIKTTNNINSDVNWAINNLLEENATEDEAVKAAQDYLYECWQKSKSSGEDFIKIISEEVSLNDMFNEDAVDPKTKIIQERYRARMDELDNWGFIGEATEDMFDDYEDDDDYDPELSEEEYALMYGDGNDIEYDLEDEEIDGWDDSMLEAALPAAERNKLPTAAFGLPKERKFPLHDEKHVKLAVKMFGHCPEKDRKELAKNIDKAMTKFKINMKISKKNPIAQYLPKERINEVSEELLARCKALENKSKKTLDNMQKTSDNSRKAGEYAGRVARNEEKFDKSKLHEDIEVDELVVYTETANGIINEGNVKEAIDSLKFSLESVSDNKIMSASSLSKLRTIESKLTKAKSKYVKYLNRYKKKWNENKKSGSKSKLQITFNKMKISNPKAFMKQYGEYIKLINKKLKLVEKRRAQLKKAKSISESVDLFGQIEMDNLDYINRIIDEALTKPDSETFTYLDEATDPNIQRYLDAANAEADRQAKSANQARREADRLRNELERTRNINRENQQKADDRLANEKRRADAAEKKLADNTPNITNRGDRNLYNHSTFNDKEVFTKMDMQKANDAVPFFANAKVGFIVEGDRSEEVVTRDVLIGIKAFVHRVESRELINNLYNTIINKRKFLKFVKFVSGEEKSLSDLLFGFKELRDDALNTRTNAGRWTSALKHRRRIAKASVPYLMKEYTPNGTLIMTKNEVDFIKAEYGIDVMDSAHVKMIMDDQFLLGFVVIDQSEELLYVVYDGHDYGFQTYTFAMLERDKATSDRELRALYRAMSR